jgi:hypothetical protein
MEGPGYGGSGGFSAESAPPLPRPYVTEAKRDISTGREKEMSTSTRRRRKGTECISVCAHYAIK